MDDRARPVRCGRRFVSQSCSGAIVRAVVAEAWVLGWGSLARLWAVRGLLAMHWWVCRLTSRRKCKESSTVISKNEERLTSFAAINCHTHQLIQWLYSSIAMAGYWAKFGGRRALLSKWRPWQRLSASGTTQPCRTSCHLLNPVQYDCGNLLQYIESLTVIGTILMLMLCLVISCSFDAESALLATSLSGRNNWG